MMDDLLIDGYERFYLCRIQISNWGTFSGYHDIPVSEKGHLFVGGSGSGKSTILDAVSVLLTPRTINFNAAARQGEKRSDRSFMSYIRGAWSSEADGDGRAASKYLRTKSTWSAIALTYHSNLDRRVTLLFIGVAKGTSKDESNVKKNYFVIPSDFNLMDIKDFGIQDFDVRLVKKRYPQAQSFSRFAPYSECFRRFFGIRDEKVLDLLHKAQSAKNMGDINFFFREFMLDAPRTSEEAETLVENFSRLDDAYQLVKKARAQVEILSQAKKADIEREQQSAVAQDCLDKKNAMEAWQATMTEAMLKDELPAKTDELKNTRDRLEVAQASRDSIYSQLETLRQDLFRSGGEALSRLEFERNSTEKNLQAAKKRQEKILPYFGSLQLSVPKSLTQWQKQREFLNSETDNLLEKLGAQREIRDTLNFDLRTEEENFKRLVREIEAMKRHPSNIPATLLELRESLTEALGLEESDLPFVGELMQIKPEEQKWQGALERVVNQFACSVLVSEAHYADLARYLDKTHLGKRLVYFRVGAAQAPKDLPEDSLPTKFDLKNGPWRQWLFAELSKRFAYVCVESTAEFAAHEKAVTLSGQVKHNATRHEKDDRFKVSDSTRWVTGFDNRQKRSQYENDAANLAVVINTKKKELNGLEDETVKIRTKIDHMKRLLDVDWSEFDTANLTAELSRIDKELAALQAAKGEILDIKNRIAEKEVELKNADKLLLERNTKLSRLQEEKEKLEAELAAVQKQLEKLSITPELIHALRDLDEKINIKTDLSLSSIQVHVNKMNSYLDETRADAMVKTTQAESNMVKFFEIFVREYPEKGADFVPDVRGREEFFAELERLEQDGLPQFEQNFRDLLENHAKQNLIDLYKEIDREKREIKSRMQEVNESLEQAVFNRIQGTETHLIIDIKDRHLDEFKEFRDMQAEILRQADEQKSLREAELYYGKLKDLVSRLDSKNPDYKQWRERVLDVREHVVFQGREVDDQGNVLDIYDSGAGKSGGQRQKLTMTCLVAALRYQLGGNRQKLPTYAPILMDEAFDKADSEFTDLSMKIFHDFGFQPVIATPEKGLYTLEPYMGSFSYVSCRDRISSSAMTMQPEKLKQALSGESVENA